MKRYKRVFGGWQNTQTGELVDNRLLVDELDYRYQTEYTEKPLERDYVRICDTKYRGKLVAVDENHVSIEDWFAGIRLERRSKFEREVYDALWKETPIVSLSRRINNFILRYVIPVRSWLAEAARYKPVYEKKVKYRLTPAERQKIKSMTEAFASDLKIMYREDSGAVFFFVDSGRCDFEYVTVLGLYDDPYDVYKAVLYSPEYRNRHPSSAKANACLFLDYDGYRHTTPAEIKERCAHAVKCWREQQVSP